MHRCLYAHFSGPASLAIIVRTLLNLLLLYKYHIVQFIHLIWLIVVSENFKKYSLIYFYSRKRRF